MKCPKCRHDQKKKDGLICGQCSYRFVLSEGVCKDNKWNSLLDQASQNGTYYFTENHLLMLWAHKVEKNTGSIGCLFMFVSLFAAVYSFSEDMVLLGVGLLFALGLATLFTFTRKPRWPIDRTNFDSTLSRWLANGRTIPRLLREPGLHSAPPNYREPDIFAYGVERVVIVQHDLLVDLLVKNGLHAEQRALVVSVTGYPQYLEPVAKRVLAENPELPVFILHDASSEGAALESQLRLRSPLRNELQGRPLVDLGLARSDVKTLGLPGKFKISGSESVPVDGLAFGTLAGALSVALPAAVAFAPLIANKESIDGHGSSHFG